MRDSFRPAAAEIVLPGPGARAGQGRSDGRGATRGARRRRRDGGAFGVVSAMPFVVLVLVFAGYAWWQVVEMAFSRVRVQGGRFLWTFAGLDNFRAIAGNPTAMHSIVNTVVFVFATVLISVLLGLALAFLVQASVLFSGIARRLIIWPAIVAPVVVSVIWLLVLSPNIGLLNKILGTFGWPAQGWLGTEIGAMASIVLVDVWHWTPVCFLLIHTALLGIDVEMLEAARSDGASEWQVTWLIQLPLLLPAIAATAFIRAVMGVKAFDEMYLLTNGGPNDATTLVSLHLRDVFFDQLDLGYGAAFSMVVVGLVTAAIASAVLMRAVLRRRHDMRAAMPA